MRHDNSDIREFDTSCFSGEYVTGDVTDEYLDEVERRRNDSAKQQQEAKRKGRAAMDAPHAKSTDTAVGM